jgi:hypothetical protein
VTYKVNSTGKIYTTNIYTAVTIGLSGTTTSAAYDFSTTTTITTTSADSDQPAFIGNCGDDITWELKDGVLTISGTGDMDDSVWGSPFSHMDYSEIVIRDGVTRIGMNAFADSSYYNKNILKTITKVTIPDSVTSIGNNAFTACYKLPEIIIPASVTTIGDYAFHNCSELTIKGAAGSYAETYAKENDIPFEAISDTTETTTTTTTTTTYTITTGHYDVRPVVEYDDSPMKIGETRTVKVYGSDKTVKGKIRSMNFNSDYITCDYKEGDDSFTITAVAAVGYTDIWVYESSCTLSGNVGITIIDEQYVSTETTTTTTTTIPDDSTTTIIRTAMENDFSTLSEYNRSPMKIGETRPVYFYSYPDYKYAGLEEIELRSDCITYSYNKGDEVIYITAVSPGKAELAIRQEGTVSESVVHLTVIDEQYESETDKVEVSSDIRKRARLLYFGQTDVKDAQNILDYVAGKELPEKTADRIKERGDIDGNGEINALDASWLLAYLKDTRLPGDVDEDRKITATDASFVLSYAADIASGTSAQNSNAELAEMKCFTYGDMDGDGKITSIDASLILIQYANLSGNQE